MDPWVFILDHGFFYHELFKFEIFAELLVRLLIAFLLDVLEELVILEQFLCLLNLHKGSHFGFK